MRGASAGTALAIALCAGLARPAVATPLGAPIPSAAGAGVRWSRPVAGPSVHDALAGRLRAARGRADSLAAWSTALGDSLLRPYALRRVAALQLAIGDSAGASATLGSLARERSPWQWEALRARSDIAQARGASARADSQLAEADRADWPDEERAAWLARRVELRLALNDSATAITFARQMIARYPASPRSAGSLRILELLLAARGDTVSADEEALAAEVDRLHGRGESAAARWSRAARASFGSTAAGRYVRLARVLRELRRYRDAREAAAAALHAARTPRDSLDARLERARALRAAGAGRQALAAYADAGRSGSGAAAEAWWERARLHEERGEWKAARADYQRVVGAGGGRAELASVRAGLMSLAAGQSSAALEWFARGDSEGARFWRGVLLRRSRRASGDSLLRVLAALPGYTFYRCAARDTLRMSGWRGHPVEASHAPSEPGLRLARALDELGCSDDAGFVMDRWAAGDARFPGSAPGVTGRSPGAWLAGAAAAYRADRPRRAIRYAERAVGRLGEGADSVAWALSPWLYPPAHDSLFAAWPESAAADRLDRALLRAVAWKESHFDPRARSRSDAVGLLQLMRPAVTDVAGWLREAAPSDSALLDPALNLRYGAQYLQRQLTRFKGDLPLALAAYNAGASVARRWTRLRSLGGDALACEEIDFPETQDYVKTILAVRQAYRELRPTPAP